MESAVKVSSAISPVDVSSTSSSDCAAMRCVSPKTPRPIQSVPITNTRPVIPGQKISSLERLHFPRYYSDLLIGHLAMVNGKGRIGN